MKSYSLKLKALVFATGLLFTPSEGIAQTVVTSTANGGSGTLRNAVINSSAGDTITFSPSLLANGSDTITLTSDIIVYHGLVIQGINTATDTLYIDGAKQSRLFYLNMGSATSKNVIFENMTFINGKPIVAIPSGPEHGGAIRAVGVDTLGIYDCIFRGHETYNVGLGGAIHGLDCHVEIVSSVFDGNSINTGTASSYTSGGALYVEEGSVKITNSIFKNNDAYSWGGAICADESDIVCENSLFTNNFVAGGTGGAVVVYKGNVKFKSTMFKGNSCYSIGSGLYVYNDPATSPLHDSIIDCLFKANTITANSSGAGRGALYAHEIVMVRSMFLDNQSNGNCAGFNVINSQVIDCSISNNTAAYNAAAAITNNSIVRNTTIEGNTAQNGDHSVLIGGKTIFRNVTVMGNSQDDEAIGSYSGDTLVISNSIVCGNGQYWYEDGIDVSALISGGYNIIRNNPTGTVTTDLTNYNSPLNLKPMGMYGGITPTMPPMTTSAAYNAGDPTKFQKAQNGPIYGRRDIGAAEHRHIVSDTTLGCGAVSFWGATYNAPGTYYDTVYNANSIDSVGVLVLTGLDTSVVNNNGVLIAQDSNTATTYQWVDCNNGYAPVSGATGSSFVPTMNGTYALILSNGTCTDTSSCHLHNEVSIEEHTQRKLHFYPNPALDRLSIVTHEVLPKELRIVDLTGKVVARIPIENAEVNLPSLTDGVYLLHWVFEANRVQVDRVMIL